MNVSGHLFFNPNRVILCIPSCICLILFNGCVVLQCMAGYTIIHTYCDTWIISKFLPFSPIRYLYAISLLSHFHFGTEPRTQVLQERGDSTVWKWRNPSPTSPPLARTLKVGPTVPAIHT